TGQEDIVVGTSSAGRNRVEIERLIGFFINTLVLRSDLSGNRTFRELLARVREVALQAYAHQDLPFERLVEQLQPERNLAYAPFTQVMFGLQNYPNPALEMSGLTVSPLDVYSETAKVDLTLQIKDESQGLQCLFEYNTDLFDETTVTRMMSHFQTLLQGIVADAARPIGRLPLLTQAERHRLVVQWNDTKKEYPKEKRIHELFEEQVERSPDEPAVVYEERQFTYRELNSRANRLAHYLKKRGVGTEVRVAIYMERSSEMVVALLAALKAGGAYVPLDPEYPRERLEFILEDAHPAVLLTEQALAERLPDHKATAVYVDRDREAINQESNVNPAGGRIADSLAYVIYTSGSTGKPKGIAVQERQLLNYCADIIRQLNPGPGCSFAMVQ
ncbi:MAG: non-ribosomal peptide synthetase, partial [Candidatus Binatia bacterium]